jgi:uncharacterized membrane protein
MYNPPPGGQSQPPYGSPSPSSLQPQEDNDKIFAALSYIIAPIMSAVILLTDMKNKPFLKYHAYQSLVLGLALIIIYTILGFTVVGLCLTPALIIGQFYFAYQAYTKGIFAIPGLTDLTAKFFKDFPAGRIPPALSRASTNIDEERGRRGKPRRPRSFCYRLSVGVRQSPRSDRGRVRAGSPLARDRAGRSGAPSSPPSARRGAAHGASRRGPDRRGRRRHIPEGGGHRGLHQRVQGQRGDETLQGRVAIVAMRRRDRARASPLHRAELPGLGCRWHCQPGPLAAIRR